MDQSVSNPMAETCKSDVMDSAVLPPMLNGWPVVGNLVAWRLDPIRFLQRALKAYPKAFRYRIGPHNLLYCGHPEIADRILRINAKNYTKSSLYQGAKPLLGNGLIMSEGDVWRSQRRLMQTAFHEPAIARGINLIKSSCARMVGEIESFAKSGAPFDINLVLSNFTLEVITHMIFGDGISRDESQAVYHNLNIVVPAIYRRMYALLPLPLSWPTPANRTIREAISCLDAIIARHIAAIRRGDAGSNAPGRGGEGSSTLLGRMLATRDENGAEMSDQQLRDEVMTIFLAGNETTATVLTWLMTELTADEALQLELGRAIANYTDYDQENDFLESVLYETMRLYPPAWAVGRQAKVEDHVGNVRIIPEDLCFVPIYFIHRHPEFWTEPEKFQSMRFLSPEFRHKFNPAYIPFASGLRSCLGKHLSLLEMRVGMGEILKRFSFQRVNAGPVVASHSIVLKPKDPVMVRARLKTDG